MEVGLVKAPTIQSHADDSENRFRHRQNDLGYHDLGQGRAWRSHACPAGIPYEPGQLSIQSTLMCGNSAFRARRLGRNFSPYYYADLAGKIIILLSLAGFPVILLSRCGKAAVV